MLKGNASLELRKIQDLIKLGRTGSAYDRSVKASKKWPKVAAFPRLAGIAAGMQGRHTVAKVAFGKAWRLAPNQPEFVQNYGASLLQCGEAEAALSVLRKFELSTELPCSLLYLRALALFKMRDDKASLAVLELALHIDPTHLESAILQIDVLQELRLYERALAAARQLIDQRPELAMARLKLSKLFGAQGDFANALLSIRCASDLEQENGEALRFWAKIPGLTDIDRDTLETRTNRILRSERASHANRAMAFFAAAALARSAGELTDEMRHLGSGHRLLAKQHENPTSKLDELQRRRLSQALPPKIAGQMERKPKPIFVVGLPRSGTTLVEQILSSHSKVEGVGELISVPKWVEHFESVTDPESCSEVLASFYNDHLPALPETAHWFVDKMPANYAHLGLIAQAFPDAPIVNTTRHPCDIALSMWREAFMAEGMVYAHDQRWMADEADRYQRYMRYWHTLMPGRILDVSYEKLVTSLECEVRRIAKHCCIDFESSMLDPQKNGGTATTASLVQIRQAVSSSSIGGWQASGNWLDRFVERLDRELWNI